MSKKFLSEIGDLITEKYESDLEEISKNHSGYNRESLLENLEKWHKFMMAELSELTVKEAGVAMEFRPSPYSGDSEYEADFDITINRRPNNDNFLF